MKALSLIQPWATLISIGAKRIETRSWAAPYRGEIAIHASKWRKPNGKPINLDVEACLESCLEQPFRAALVAGGIFKIGDLPSGAIVALATLVQCSPTANCLEFGATFGFNASGGRRWELTREEQAFGDFHPGRYAWLLENVRPLRQPVECRGAQGLWTVLPETEAAVRAQS